MLKKKMALALILLCTMTGSMAADAAFLDSALGSTIATSVLQGIFRTSRKTTAAKSTGSSRKQKYKDALSMIHNFEWVGIAKSSGGDVYFNQDTLEITSRKPGDRRVVALMKNTFTDSGSKALIEDSNGQIQKGKKVDYSLFKVEYGENECRIVSHVFYYDAKGNELLKVEPEKALLDVKSGHYGKPYVNGSQEEKTKEKVFYIAFESEDASETVKDDTAAASAQSSENTGAGRSYKISLQNKKQS